MLQELIEKTFEELKISSLKGCKNVWDLRARKDWMELGNALREREELPEMRIEGEKWITLRLDGSSFGKMIKAYRKTGIFGKQGYDVTFAELMDCASKAVMEKFHGLIAFTQSDEVTVVLEPAPFVNEVRMAHIYNGRKMKLCSMAASIMTSAFTLELVKILRARGQEALLTKAMELPPVFDCRIGVFDSYDEALALILWRAYDCHSNAFSDAIFNNIGVIEGAKAMVSEASQKKFDWLGEHGLLPLNDRQQNGTIFRKVKKEKVGYNPITKTETLTSRNTIESSSTSCLVFMVANGEDILSSEKVPSKMED